MDLLRVFETIERSSVGQAIQLSPWAFAVIESMHLLAFATLGGAVLLVDLRMLGIGLSRQPVARLAEDVQPIIVMSLGAMVATGIGLFVSEAIKCYYSTPFRLKMACLVAATLFTFTVRRRITRAAPGRVHPVWQALVALVSLSLWFGVAASGRWIGFSG